MSRLRGKILKLTAFTDYSLRTLIYLAVHPDRLCTASEVAAYFEISQNHMSKVTHNLSKAGYISTKKGKNGGMVLSALPKEIKLGEVIKKIEPNFDIAECFNCEENTCKISAVCRLKGAFFSAYTAFIEELNGYTLADVTKTKGELLNLFEDS